MARAATWSVKGIDRDTRALAREAAAQSGLTIGVWIDRSIRLRTGLPEADHVADAAAEPTASLETAISSARERTRTDAAAMTAGQSPFSRYVAAAVVMVGLIAGGYVIVDGLRVKRDVKPEQVADAMPAARPAGPAAPLPAESGPTAAMIPAATPDATAQSASLAGARAMPSPAHESPMARLITEAKANDPRAQYDLGQMYAGGDGVPRDYKEAARWLEAAASQGLPQAEYSLGELYEKGRGVARNDALAVFWYRSAAKKSHAQAQYNLATMLVEGRGAPRNYVKAGELFTKAAASGEAESLFGLGMLYEHGLGRTRDMNAALESYRRAKAAGSQQAAKRLAELARAGKPAVAEEAPATATVRKAPDRPLDKKGIAELQRLLEKLDLSPGRADGVLGSQTVSAIRMYQQFAGLDVTGKATKALLVDLRQVVGAMNKGRARN